MNINVRRHVYLSVGFIILLLTGLIYAWSIFIVPLENDFGWDRTQTSIIFTITMAAFCLGSVANGFLIGKIGPRITLIGAAILFFFGFFLASRTTELWQIFISYGVFVGAGVGIVYNTMISTIGKWFPDKKGFASGVSLMGFGLGGFILGSVASSLISIGGWRTVFVVFAIAFPVAVLISSFIIRAPKEIETDNLPAPKAAANSEDKTQATALKNSETIEKTTGNMLKTPVFWVYFVWTILLSAAGLVVIGHAATIAEGFASLPLSIPFTVGLVTIFNGVARVCFGVLFDKLGLSKCLYAVAGVGVLAAVGMLLSIVAGSPILLILSFVLTGMFYGGTPTTNTTFVMSQFGQKHFAANFSVMNLCLLIAPTLGTYMAGALWTSTGTYLSATAVMAGYTVVAMLLSFVINRMIRK